MRFRIEIPRHAMIAMQRRYAGDDGWSTWWTDLGASCRGLQATYHRGYTGPCLIEGDHDDREPVATRLIRELLSEA